jgi:hypothetical protein
MPVIKEQYPATVTSTEDDLKRGRIKVKCLGITGDENIEIPSWIDPCFDWGWFYVPDVDEQVEIECVVHDDTAEGAPGQAFLESPRYRWRGKRYQSDEGAAPPHELMTATNYGKRRGFATPLGHVLMFDDTPGAEQITLSWTNKANDQFSFLSFDKDGGINLNNAFGASLFMDVPNKTTTINNDKNLIVLSPVGVQIIDKFSNIVELKDGVVQVLAQKDLVVKAGANVTVEASKVNVKSGDILIGDGADSPFVRHTEWKTWEEAHTHPTAFGPSGPPIAPTTPTIASTTAKVK